MDVILHHLAHIAKVHSVEVDLEVLEVVDLLTLEVDSEVEEAVTLWVEEAQLGALEMVEDVRVKYKVGE